MRSWRGNERGTGSAGGGWGGRRRTPMTEAASSHEESLGIIAKDLNDGLMEASSGSNGRALASDVAQ